MQKKSMQRKIRKNLSTTASAAQITTHAADQNKRPHLEVGARVEILQHKHLRCARFGFIQFINGAYISVRPEDQPPVESDACERTFECYPNELKLIATYSHPDFKPGAVVRIKKLDWRNVEAKCHGIVTGVEAERILVRPIGSHDSAIASISPDDLVLELNDDNLSAESLALQVAILAILKALGGTVQLTQLEHLLATQKGLYRSSARALSSELARLANAGKITLTAGAARAVNASRAEQNSAAENATATELTDSLSNLLSAELRLAEAVRQAILSA
jgi:hypothetical protein